MADRDERPDGNIVAQVPVLPFHDVLGYPHGRGFFREKTGGQPDKIEIRLRRDQLGPVQIRIVLGDDESRGIRLYGLFHQSMTDQQSQIAWRCLFETVDACNTKIRLALKLCIDGTGQFG